MDALDFGHGSSSAAAPAAGAASGSTTSAEGWAASQAAAAGPIAATRRPSRLSATLASPTAVQEPAGRPFALQHTGSSALQQLPRIDSVSDVDAKGNASPQPSRTPDKVPPSSTLVLERSPNQEKLAATTVSRLLKAYPWLYFLSAIAPLALALRWLCWRLYKAAEYTAIREELYFLRPLKAKVAGVLFWLAILLWFQVCFTWVWCDAGRCDQPAYQEAMNVVWKLIICLTLFSVAGFIKCSLARLLSYQFYRTAHFQKVKQAIERELYLIRLSKARRTLVCSPPTPSPAVPGTGVCSQAYAGHPYAGMTVAGKAGAWLAERGSTIWRRGSAIMNPGHLRNLADENEVEVCDSGFSQMHEADVATGDGRASPFSLVARDFSRHSCKSATAAADSSRHSCKSFAADEERKDGMGGEIDCVEVTAYIVPAGSGQKQHQQPPPRMHTSSSDGIPLLSPPGTRTHSLSAGIGAAPAALSDKPSGSYSKPGKQQAQCELQGSLSSGLNNMQRAAVQNSRQPSFEEFCRAPSLLGPAAKQKAGMQGVRNWLGVGGPRGSRTSKAAGSRIGSHVSLRDMVPGVDGMLLQPEVVEEVTNNGRTMSDGGDGLGKPMTEQELAVLRKAMGVNSYGTFVDRYYGLSPKEEAAHLRHVERYAKGLFHNIRGDADRDYLLPSDFWLFFDGDIDTATEAFAYFDRNGDGSISCSELQESAAEMLCERKNIAASIKDTDSVVDSLETGMGLLVHLIFFCFYLLVWGINIVKGFTTFSATVLALTFVFGNSARSVFESAIFLFVEHPYDVGDLLGMPDSSMARVKKINLLYTQLTKGSGELVWYPNTQLQQMALINISRSGPRWEGHTWLVDIDTPDEVLESVNAAVAEHVANHAAHFNGRPLVTWRGLEEPLKIRLQIGVPYSFSGEDLRRLGTTRSALLGVVRKELHRLGVHYTLPATGSGQPAVVYPAKF
ncbi:hypothetical protein OEZ85_011803 [Tetradesmus obliquus]|uniref:EF-hand domain-containing protein n=1 Tax=Tetradesmus obliquus TaxID=3088 RepID=A0ABY8TRE9_TETOB|nr:hypothetical protein OEZ85_011803 [Tetradesmus obliquus]